MSVTYKFDFDSSSTTFNTSLRNKGASQLIDVNKDLIDKYNLKVYLATLTYDPSVIKNNDAWNHIHSNRLKALDVLKQHDEIEFAVSTVEMHHGKKNDKGTEGTLIGYPHIHICIGVSTSTGMYTQPNTISKWFMDANIMPDVDVREKRTKISSFDSLKYVLKDSTHEKTYLLINAYEMGVSLGYNVLKNNKKTIEKIHDNLSIPSIILGFNRLVDIQNMFRDLISFTRVKQRIPMTIAYLSGGIEEPELEDIILDDDIESESVSSVKTSTSSVRTEEDTRLATQTPLLVGTSIVKSYMYDNDLVLSQNNNVYKKISGSKMSYRHYSSTVLDVCKEALGGKEHSKYAKEAKTIAEFMEVKNHRDSTFKCPRIEFDYHVPWIEFGDCFYCPLINMCIREQNVYPCYMYEPNIKFRMLEPLMDRFSKKSKWAEIIHNWGYTEDKEASVCSTFFTTMIQPRHHKSKALNLVGDSNAGKTTLLMPFRQLYPPDQISVMKQTIGKFDAYQYQHSALIVGEEVNPHLLRPVNLALKALSGEEIAVEEKFGAPTKAHMPGRYIFTSNPDEHYEDMKRENIKNRTVEVWARKFRNPVNRECDIVAERGVVIVYSSCCYHTLKNEGNPVLPMIIEEFDVIESLIDIHKRDVIDHSHHLPLERMKECSLFEDIDFDE